MKKAALLGFCLVCLSLFCQARVNIQLLYDCVDAPYTTIETYKGDRWGDTYFFIDHYYATREDRKIGLGSAYRGSYFEIERGLNFWHDTRLKDFYLHVEYDGSSWGKGMACIGAKYAFHNTNFSRTASVALMYDHYIGPGSANVPLKFTGVWKVERLFGVGGLTFDGFIDVWGNNTEYITSQMGIGYDHFSIVSQPQLWMNMSVVGVPNLNLGGEAVLGYNHHGSHGFSMQPGVGIKWAF